MSGEENPIETGAADGSLLGSELGNDLPYPRGVWGPEARTKQKTGRQ